MSTASGVAEPRLSTLGRGALRAEARTEAAAVSAAAASTYAVTCTPHRLPVSVLVAVPCAPSNTRITPVRQLTKSSSVNPIYLR